MLQGIRNATKNWVGYAILFILTMFLVAAFALWGVGDIFRGGIDTTVATVGERTIDRTTFDRELKNQLRAYSAQQQREISVEEARATGFDKVILDRLIERMALDQRVRALGLTASDDAVRSLIHKDQTFEGGSGTFDKNRFARLLNDAGIGETEYVETVRGDVARQQYMLAAVAGIGAPPRLARLIYDYVSEQRVAEYIVVAPADAGNPSEPAETELADYHKAHVSAFSTPEYREIEFVQIGVNEVAGEIPITEAAIKAAWDRRKNEFQKLEKREIQQIAFSSQAAAAAAHARIQSGAEFLTVANEAGKSEADVKLGTFDRTEIDPRLAGAAFALAAGGVSAPVQGPFNWVILRVVRIVPGETKTFEQMRERVRADLLKEAAAERITVLMNKLEDELGSGKTLAQAAVAAGLPVHRVTVDAKGLLPAGTKAPVPAAPVFLQQVFAADPGASESDPFSDEDQTQYVVRVIGARPPAPRPLDTVRAQVRERWLADRRASFLLARVKALAARAQGDRSLAEAARSLGRATATSAPLTRGSAGDVFSAEALARIFASPAGTAVYGRAGKGGGYVLARVTRVVHPEAQANALDGFRNEVAGQVARDIGQALTLAARAQAGVEINQQNLQAAPGEAQ